MRLLLLVAMLAGFFVGPAAARQTPPPVVIESRTLKFDSGLRVVIARTPPRGEPPRVHVAAYEGFGSRDEFHPGEAHFIEHIVAGSPPAAGALPAAPADATTYQSNAVTRHNHTSYVRAVSPDAVEAMIASRLIRIGRVDRDDAIVERERARVLTELERTRGNAGFSAYKALDGLTRDAAPDLAAETAFVTGVSPAEIWDTIDRVYRPDLGALVVAGDVDLNDTEALVRRRVEDLALDRSSERSGRLPRKSLPNDGRSVVLAQNPSGVFSAAIAFPQPDHGSDDYLAFMVLDQLLMGGRAIEEGVPRPGRSDQAPLAVRLNTSLGATTVYDGKDSGWGVPFLAEGDPALYAVTLLLPRADTPDRVRKAVLAALADIRVRAASDADVTSAAASLADFYEAWLRVPDGRVLADHLANLPHGWSPEDLNTLSARLRATPPDRVRSALDRLLEWTGAPVVVLTPPAP